MATTDGILEYACWIEEIAPGFIAMMILAEKGEDYRDRDLLDQVACLSRSLALPERHRSSGARNCLRHEARWRPMRRDREDQLDLAHVGGEANTATHGASIAGPGRGRQTAGQRERLAPATGPRAIAPRPRLLNNLISAGEDRWRDSQTERLRGFQIDDE